MRLLFIAEKTRGLGKKTVGGEDFRSYSYLAQLREHRSCLFFAGNPDLPELQGLSQAGKSSSSRQCINTETGRRPASLLRQRFKTALVVERLRTRKVFADAKSLSNLLGRRGRKS